MERDRCNEPKNRICVQSDADRQLPGVVPGVRDQHEDWLQVAARFKEEGVGGNERAESTRAPSPESLGEETICRMIKLKERHRHGGRGRSGSLPAHAVGRRPSESSFKRVLERAGYREAPGAALEQVGREQWQESDGPANEVWTVDFKGWWYGWQGGRAIR